MTPERTIKKYLIVQKEGQREVSRNTDHYNLQMIIAADRFLELEETVSEKNE